jgi:hypothetical protein
MRDTLKILRFFSAAIVLAASAAMAEPASPRFTGQGCSPEQLAQAADEAAAECDGLGFACWRVENCCQVGPGPNDFEYDGFCNNNTPCAEYFEPYSGPPCP